MSKNKKELSIKFRRALFIANSAYGPMADFTLDEWFKAIEFVKENKSMIPKFH